MLRRTIKNLSGVKVCRDAPSVSHLLFADDSLILMKADASNAACLKNCLYSDCASSGQLVSDGKSSIYLSPNTTVDHRVEVCTALNIMTEALTDKYAGLPPLVGAEKSHCFKDSSKKQSG